MDYNIKLGIQLDSGALANIKKDLDTKISDKKITIKINSEELEQIKDLLNNIYLELGRIEKKNGFSNVTKNAKEFNSELEKTTKHIKNQSFATDNWAYNWSKAMQSFLTYNTVTQFFNTVMNGIKDMIEQVKDLDKALVELQKVTDLEGESLKKFVAEAYEAGEAVAKTGTEMVEAATAFAKAGYKEEALQLGTVAAMYTNIADEEIKAADAADMIIAQMKAFNITAEDSIHIIDAINEVSNNYAVSSADIARNLGKASAVMANAGNSMEQYIGLMTAATEVTRNASKAANGLKTLTLRLQGMNDEGEKDLEIQAQMEGLFNKLGISVYKANGELKNTYEILETLAPIYKELTNAEKAYVTETIAGKYQAQNAAAILNNWSTAVDATKTAMESAGSAASENAKVLDSIQGHMQKLSSAWEKLSKSIISSDLIKFIVDLGAELLELVNNDITKFLIKFVAISMAVKGLASGFKLLTVAIKANKLANSNLIKSIVLLIQGEQGLGKWLTKNQVGYAKLTAAEKREQIQQQKNAAASLKQQLAVSAVALAITAAITAIDAYREHQMKMAEEARELEKSLASSASNSYDTYKNNKDSLSDQIQKYKDLKNSLENEQHTLSEQLTIKSEIYGIQKDIVDKYGEQAKGVDLVNGKLSDQLEILGEINVSNAKKWLEDNSAAIKSSKTALSRGYYGDNKNTGNWLEMSLSSGDVAHSIGEAIGADEYGYITGGFVNFLGDILTTYENYGFKFEGTAEEIRQKLENALTLLEDANWTSQFDLTKEEIDTAKRAIQTELSEIDEYIKEHQAVLNQYAEMLAVTDEKYRGEYGKFLEAQKEYQKAAVDNNTKAMSEAEAKISEFHKFVSGLDDDPIMKNYFEQLLSGWSKQLKNADIDKQIQNKQWNIEESIKKLNSLNLNADAIKSLGEMYKNNDWDLSKFDKETYDSIWEFAKAAYEADVDLEGFIDRLEELGLIAPGAAKSTNEASSAIRVYSGELKTIKEDLENLEAVYNTLSGAAEEYEENQGLSLDTLLSLLELEPKYLQYLIDENGQINFNKDAINQLAVARLNDAKANIIQTAMKELDIVKNNSDAEAVQKLKDKYNILAGQLKDTGAAYQELAGKALEYKAVEGITDEQKGLMDKIVANAKRNIDLIDKLWNGSLSKGSGSSKTKTSKASSASTKEWWEEALDALKNQFNYNEITVEQYINSLTQLLGKVQKGTEAWNKINQELQKQKLDKIKDDYNAGRISLNQYIISLQNLQKEYKEGTKAWNDLAEAIKKAKLDALKNQQNDLKSALSAVNKELDKQIDGYEKSKEAAVDSVEAQIEEQEKLKDSLNDNIDDYERAQKAVLKYLNEQLNSLNENKNSIENYYDSVIDSVEKMNDEQEKAVELAEAYENLMNAMTQKTKKVWREGLGWIWETDQDAIKEAQKTYDDLVKQSQLDELEKNKTQTLETLDEEIEALTNYITSWEEVLDKFENEKNKNLADLLLGENWSEAVSQLDPDVVNDFSNAYYNLQKSLEETEERLEQLNEHKKEIEEYYDGLIDKVKEYKDAWGEVTSELEDSLNKEKANQLLMANWERDILSQRIEVLEDFKNKYNAILSEIDKVDNMSTNSASNYTPYSLPGYSNGGEVDFTGLAMLHGSISKPEYVLNNDQMRNLLSHLTKPQYSSNINSGSSIINNYNFGDIELPNVNNAQQFINELKSLINTSKNL